MTTYVVYKSTNGYLNNKNKVKNAQTGQKDGFDSIKRRYAMVAAAKNGFSKSAQD